MFGKSWVFLCAIAPCLASAACMNLRRLSARTQIKIVHRMIFKSLSALAWIFVAIMDLRNAIALEVSAVNMNLKSWVVRVLQLVDAIRETLRKVCAQTKHHATHSCRRNSPAVNPLYSMEPDVSARMVSSKYLHSLRLTVLHAQTEAHLLQDLLVIPGVCVR